jgi:hypothetical protein
VRISSQSTTGGNTSQQIEFGTYVNSLFRPAGAWLPLPPSWRASLTASAF